MHDNGIVYQEVPQPSKAGDEELVLTVGRESYDTENGLIGLVSV